MSNQDKNKGDEKLRDLLGKAHGAGDLDAFDKEALEGYSSLTNEQSMRLKSELDAQVSKTLFEKDKQKSRAPYWYAAAALLLAVGFSVYFINNNPPVKDTDLALRQEPQPKLESPPKVAAPEKGDLKSPEVVEPEKQSMAATKPETKTRKLNAGKLSAETPAAGKEAQPESHNADVENLAAVAAAPAVQTANEDLAPQQNVNKSLAYESAAKTRDDSPELEKKAKSVNHSEQERAFSARGMAKQSLTTNNECKYRGGESALKKELSDKLISEDLNQRFEALLTIGEDYSVSAVELTKTFALDKTQQKQIVIILKSLNKFYCQKNDPEKKCEYKLVFEP